MTDDKKSQEQIWNEVGEEFDAMGKSIAAAVDEASLDEKNQQELKEVQTEYGATVAQIREKINVAKETGEKPNLDAEATKLGELSTKVGEGAAAIGMDTAKEAEPHLAGALKSLQSGFNQLVKDIKK